MSSLRGKQFFHCYGLNRVVNLLKQNGGIFQTAFSRVTMVSFLLLFQPSPVKKVYNTNIACADGYSNAMKLALTLRYRASGNQPMGSLRACLCSAP